MGKMKSKQLVRNAIEHRAVDRIPVYFGGTSSFLSDEAYCRLRDYLGISGGVDPYRKGHTGTIYDERILDALGVDVRFLVFNLENYGVRETVSDSRVIDEWGVPIVRVGEHWSRVDPPLAGAGLRAIEAFPFPDPHRNTRNQGLGARAKELYNEGAWALVARSPHSASFLELGCWLMGHADFLCGLYEQSGEAEALLDKIMRAQIGYYQEFLGAVGPYVDIVETSEDYGTQKSLFISPETYRRMIQPRRMKINETIRACAPQAKILHHTCGAVRKLIPALIDTGIDILNPIQPGLDGMEMGALKRDFGRDLCFCGGVDMQRAINGSFAEIEREVGRCAAAMGYDGGYLFATSNHIQADTKPENVVHLFECFHSLR